MKGYNFKLIGINGKNIIKSGFINGNKVYFYENKQLYYSKIN